MKFSIKKGLTTLCIMILIIFGIQYTVYAQEKITLTVDAGYNGYYKNGYTVPLNFEIKNNLKDINGELQVEIVNDKDNLTQYFKHVNLPVNSTKNVFIDVPIFKRITKVRVKIVDSNKVVYNNEKSIKPGYNQDYIFMGVLSDDYDSVAYVGGTKSLNIGSTPVITNTIKLSDKKFPMNLDSMKMFNIIFINNFDTSKLSKDQYEGLKNWVYDGGILLIGTGASYKKTFSIFKDDFINGEIGDLRNISTKALYNLINSKTTEKNTMNINVLDMKFKKENSILKEENTTLIHQIKKGKGVVTVAAYDFGLNPIANSNDKNKFLEQILQKSIANSSFAQYYKGDVRQQEYNLTNALRNIIELPLPSIKNIIIIFLIYILLVSPISYIFLKKKNKREYMWFVVPAFSLIFVIVMYSTGFSTRITNNIANVVNIINVDESGHSNINSYGTIFTPKKTNLQVEAEKGMRIYPMTMINDRSASNKKNRKVDTKVDTSKNNYIEFYNAAVFSNNYVKIDIENNKLGSIKSNLNYYKGKYKGNIQNNLQMNLEDCYIITRNNYMKIGSLKRNESKKIDGSGNQNFDLYSFIDKEFSIPDIRVNRKLRKAKDKYNIRKSIQRSDIMGAYIDSTQNEIKQPLILGWSDEPVTKDFIVNGKKANKYEKNLIVKPIKISYTNGKMVEYPYGYFRPQFVNDNGGYDEREHRFYGMGNFEITHKIDEDINIDKIMVKYKLEKVRGDNEISKQFIWNVKKKVWQEGDYRNLTINKKDLGNYLNKNKEIKFKLQIIQSDVKGELPQISVKGSVK
ncbi:hypothetical protein ACFIJ5_17215 [Haloimpatiens sp. FM7330]|uniref:hypothetical protein n=1 Tax=Haloimpatiens sp. FM7330 TaxID=3298610 RepID=UPI00362F58AD